MNIRKATIEDAKEIRALILTAVQPDSNPDFDKQGQLSFMGPNKLSAIEERINSNDYLTLCCIEKHMIVGIITIYSYNYVYHLFVLPNSRGQGVSRQLWMKAQGICEKMGNGGKYWVKSSTMAIPVYESFGFTHEGGRQIKGGIVYYPMVLEL
ncbi:GNAT family N-acetyltransferase [Pleionea sediminis]|uniref:GNAT family N-acetyltransferase n=1 Tax=Pleionea sediminis TaxID=2569479 RepID=UPI0011852002|nr:GNAT family N-acetyltransferase [Pleionea sediminis]